MTEPRLPDAMPHNDGMSGEIALGELWLTLVKYRRMILLVTLGAAIVSTGVSLAMHNIYRAEVLIAPVGGDSKGSLLSSALAGLGGLAPIAGISLGGGGSMEQNIAVLNSRSFLWKFVQEENLMPILFDDMWDEAQKGWKEPDPRKQPGQLDVYRLFHNGGVLKVDSDKRTGLVSVAVEWKDAALAAKWANALVDRVNRHLAQQAIARSDTNLKYLNEELAHTQVDEMRKTLFDLVASEQKQAMLAHTQKDFAFEVLDPAVEPDKRARPKRLIIVLLSACVAGLLAALYAFFKEGAARRRAGIVRKEAES